jgi:hypothetical protein
MSESKTEIEQLESIIENILKEAEEVSKNISDEDQRKQLDLISRSYLKFSSRRDKLLGE